MVRVRGKKKGRIKEGKNIRITEESMKKEKEKSKQK
jgi:hypothetical protein